MLEEKTNFRNSWYVAKIISFLTFHFYSIIFVNIYWEQFSIQKSNILFNQINIFIARWELFINRANVIIHIANLMLLIIS